MKTPLNVPSEVGRTERLFVVTVLLLSSGAFSCLWTVPGQTQTAAGMAVMQVLWVTVYSITLWVFFRNCERPFSTFLSEWRLTCLCGLAMTSTLWSEAPEVTFRRSIALVFTLIFGVYVASRFSLKEQLRLLAWTCGVCICFSFIFGTLGLGHSVDLDSVPGWYGIFVQKNALGRMMALSAIVFLFWKKAEPEHKRLANTCIIASIALVVLSRSMNAALIMVLLILLMPYFWWTARKRRAWMITGLATLVVTGAGSVLYALTHIVQVTGWIGKNPTLTGRVPIWILSTAMALRRPWLGYGYSAFWLPTEWFTVRIWHVMGWDVPHAHNGFLEVWLELGLVGVALFLIVFAHYVVRGINFLRANQNAAIAAWPLIFLLFQFLSNIAEADLLSRDTIFFILFVTAAFATRSALVDCQFGRRQEAFG